MNAKKASIAAITTYCIFGFTFLAARIALEHINASVMLSLRFIISFLVMALLSAIGRVFHDHKYASPASPRAFIAKLFSVELKGKPVGKLMAMGLAQPIAYFIFETLGINYSNSSFAGIIISLVPVAATILSILFLGERFALKNFGWIFCSVAGVGILSVMQKSNGAIQIKGIVFMLLAVFAAAAFSVLSRHTAEHFSPFERSFVMMTMGCIVFTAYAVAVNGHDYLPQMKEAIADPVAMAPILYLSIISSVIAFMCLHYATSYLEISKVTSFTNVQPIISLAAGVIFLHEPVSWLHFIAIAMILLGVYKISKL